MNWQVTSRKECQEHTRILVVDDQPTNIQLMNGAGECLVEDEGPGFSAEDRKRLFSRYGRLSARPTGGEPSTGLGLSIVKKLMQNMNGKIHCDSVSGQGAAFIVRLPLSTTPTEHGLSSN